MLVVPTLVTGNVRFDGLTVNVDAADKRPVNAKVAATVAKTRLTKRAR